MLSVHDWWLKQTTKNQENIVTLMHIFSLVLITSFEKIKKALIIKTVNYNYLIQSDVDE